MRFFEFYKTLRKPKISIQVPSLAPQIRSRKWLHRAVFEILFLHEIGVCPLLVRYLKFFHIWNVLCTLLLVLQEPERSVHCLGYSGLRRLEHMAVNVQGIQPIKRTHILKIFLSRFVKRFCCSLCPFPLQGTSCAARAFRAACNRCGYRAVCLWHTHRL